MLDGAMPFQVRQYVAEKEAAGEAPWTIPEGGRPLSERQIRRYSDQADALMAEAVRTNRKKLLRRHIARRHQLYVRSVNSADYRTALAIDQDLATLQGLYPPRKIAPTNPEGGREYGAGFTNDERAAIVRAVAARFGIPDALPDAGGPVGADGSLLP